MRRALLNLTMTTLFAAAAAACGGSDGAPGAKGDPGAAGGPGSGGSGGDGSGGSASAGMIVPNVGLLDREGDVQINVAGLTVDSAPAVDFGAGVDVSNVQVVTPTTVSAHLKVSKSATIGDRDVKISAGGKDLTGTKAFHVLPPLDVKVSGGTVQQGGMFVLDVKNRDTQAFDTQNFALISSDLISFNTIGLTSTNGTFVMLAAPGAATGPTPLEGDNGNPPLQTFLSDPQAVNVAARAPVALTAPLTGEKLTQPFETRLYKVTVPATTTAIAALNVKVAADSKSSPLVVAFPSSGKWTDLLAVMQPPAGDFFSPPPPPPYDIKAAIPMASAAASQDILVMLVDQNGGGGANYTFDLSYTQVSATGVPEGAAAHASTAAAQALTVPGTGGVVVTGDYPSTDTRDVYKLTVTANETLQIAFAPQFDGALAVTDKTLSFDTSAGALAVIQPSAKSDSALVKFTTAGSYYLVVQTGDQAKTPNGKYTFSVDKP